MGSFSGHAIPGTFFLMFGVWWTIQITRRYVACKSTTVPYFNTVTFPCFCFSIQCPLEGTMKVAATAVGMIGEAYACVEPIRAHAVGRLGDYHGVYIGDIQHISMYLSFLLAGIVDILMNRRNNVVPNGLDYVASAVAFIVEFILFKFHTHGQAPLEMTLHTLLLYVIAGSAITVILEYSYAHSILVAYARAYMVFLQGTWFYQIGFILYPPFIWLRHWDETDHHNIMFATAMFNWHALAVLLIMLLLAGLTYYISYKHLTVREGSVEHMWTKVQSHMRNNVEIIKDYGSDESSFSDEDTVV